MAFNLRSIFSFFKDPEEQIRSQQYLEEQNKILDQLVKILISLRKEVSLCSVLADLDFLEKQIKVVNASVEVAYKAVDYIVKAYEKEMSAQTKTFAQSIQKDRHVFVSIFHSLESEISSKKRVLS